MSTIKGLVSRGMRLFGRELLSTTAYRQLQARSDELNGCLQQLREYEFLRSLPRESVVEFLHLLPQSRAQHRQDLFALTESGFKRGGFFVEFGATDGVELSNTWLLEKQFGWTGILAEPAIVWHQALRRNRLCQVDHRCVWTASGEVLQFAEVTDSPVLSTINRFADGDMHKAARQGKKNYGVKTVSLLDLLRQLDAPHEIDYLSIDPEGSEYDILETFDFGSYRIRIITVEHNFMPVREKIRQLLVSRGYVQKLNTVSHVDDWYVLGLKRV